jgi:hypothetical protein
MSRVWGWITGFARFWYGFVIGDDWAVAATIVAAAAVTYGLRQVDVPAWYVMPLSALAAIGVGLFRASSR